MGLKRQDIDTRKIRQQECTKDQPHAPCPVQFLNSGYGYFLLQRDSHWSPCPSDESPSQLVERDLLSASVIVGLLCLKAFRDVPSPPVQAPQQSFAKTIPASSPANPPIPPCPQSVSNHRILCCSVPLHFPAHCWLPLH